MLDNGGQWIMVDNGLWWPMDNDRTFDNNAQCQKIYNGGQWTKRDNRQWWKRTRGGKWTMVNDEK